MQEAQQEHQVTGIEFSVIETLPLAVPSSSSANHGATPKAAAKKQPSQQYGIRRQPLHMESAHFAIPSVTVSSNERLAWQRRERARRRRVTMACGLRLLILFFPMAYYKQISGFLFGAVPQTITGQARIHGDYSSVQGIHDLSTENIRPWCFVSLLCSVDFCI